MKKIFSLFALLMLFFSVPAFAQLDELKNKQIVVGDPVDEVALDTWYVFYCGGRPSYIYSQGKPDDTTMKILNINESPSEAMATDKAGFLLRFVQADDNVEGHVNIQTGFGDYFGQLTTGSNNGTTSDPEYYFTYGKIEGESSWWWFMGNDGAMVMDNNTPPSTMAGWGTSVPTASSSNAAWQIYSIEFITKSDYESAISTLKSTYDEYCVMEFETGTFHGQYGAAEVEAFNAVLAEAFEMLDDDDYSAEQILEANQKILDAYAAVIASRVSYAAEITPGYYMIKNALDFSYTEEPEDGSDPIVTHYVKAIYDNKGAAAWKSAEDNAAFLFKIEATDTPKAYKVTNMYANNTFAGITRSTSVAMAASDSLMCFDWRWDNVTVYTGNGDESKKVTTYNIRQYSDAERGYNYAHAGGHTSGAGISGNIVGWSTGEAAEVGATDWYLDPVDEATALAWIEISSPAKAITKKIDEVSAIAEEFSAQKRVAEDLLTLVDRNSPLIKEASWIESPYTEPSEGSIEEMIDGDSSTFWHSVWSGTSTVNNGVHYFSVTLPDAPELFAFEYTRRAVSGDQITEWSVYGSDNPNAEKADCELLAEVSTPLTANNETLLSSVISGKSYKYFRFYEENTGAMPDSDGGSSRGYFHVAEFQLYPATQSTIATTPQSTARATEMKAIEDALAKWTEAAYTTETVTDPADAKFNADYDAVVKAYNAWKAVYVDPAELRTALTAANNTVAGIVEGKDPGMWSGVSSSEIKSAVEAAKTYDNSGTYTPEQSGKYVESLTSLNTDFLASANKVQEGKWYNIIFPSEETYEANGWDTAGPSRRLNDDGSVYGEGLFGKYITVGNIENAGTDDVEQYTFAQIDGEITVGQTLQWADEDADDEDRHQFRFIAVGDSAYMIQNRAIGLFLKAAGTSGLVTLSPMPTLFQQNAIGYGLNLLKAIRIDGTSQSYLHAQNDMNRLVTWNASTLGCNSNMYINEAEDVASDYSAPDFNFNVYCGKVYPLCYPVNVKLTDEDASLYGVSFEGTTITLSPIKDNIVGAGVPFVLISNLWKGDKKYVTEAEDEGVEGRYRNVTFAINGYEVCTQPTTFMSLIGNFYGETAKKGDLIASENKFAAVTKTAGASVAANTAYIAAGLQDITTEITIEISADEVDNISEVLTNVSKGGKIYSANGAYLGVGNINTVKNLGRGIYVIGGTKVLVK